MQRAWGSEFSLVWLVILSFSPITLLSNANAAASTRIGLLEPPPRKTHLLVLAVHPNPVPACPALLPVTVCVSKCKHRHHLPEHTQPLHYTRYQLMRPSHAPKIPTLPKFTSLSDYQRERETKSQPRIPDHAADPNSCASSDSPMPLLLLPNPRFTVSICQGQSLLERRNMHAVQATPFSRHRAAASGIICSFRAGHCLTTPQRQAPTCLDALLAMSYIAKSGPSCLQIPWQTNVQSGRVPPKSQSSCDLGASSAHCRWWDPRIALRDLSTLT